MLFYIDFEFVEGKVPQRIMGFSIPTWLSKPNNTIQPISVGIVSGDRREYYAISKDFNMDEAWSRYDLKPDIDRGGMKKVYWIRENVLKPIFDELMIADGWLLVNDDTQFDGSGITFSQSSLRALLLKYGKTNAQIAQEVKEFCKPSRDFSHEGITLNYSEVKNPSFYGHQCAFDYVLLSQLMGSFSMWPKGWPLGIFDLKQTEEMLGNATKRMSFHDGTKGRYEKDVPFKEHIHYPKQKPGIHRPLIEARYFRELHQFLQTI